MRISKILLALLWLPIICSCSSDSPVDNSTDEGNTTTPITISASLPDNRGSRAQITYGNMNVDGGEEFLWNEGDEIYVYNFSTLVGDPKIYNFVLSAIKGLDAEFTLSTLGGYPGDFNPKRGDILVATLGEGSIKMKSATEADARKIISLYVGTESNKPQYISKDPSDAELAYMQDNLKMYDIVKVTEDGIIPELHFKHLSAIMRVTLRNNSSDPIFLTKMDFDYLNTDAFFNTTMYFSLEDTGSDIYNLKIHEDKDLYGATSLPYTSSIGTTINGKEGTADVVEYVYPGGSHELYISTVPRLDNYEPGDKIKITLIEAHDTDNPYSITIDGFNVPIKAGYRYWFDLTLTQDKQLILTPAE